MIIIIILDEIFFFMFEVYINRIISVYSIIRVYGMRAYIFRLLSKQGSNKYSYFYRSNLKNKNTAAESISISLVIRL